MTTAEIIVWIATHLYMGGQATSKKAANTIAVEIVNGLIDKGVLVTSDASPS